MSQRKQRVEHGLRDVLTELIAREIRDPRVAAALITVTKVELNVDLSVATVYVSIIGHKRRGREDQDDERERAALEAIVDGALAGLAKAAGFLRGPAGRKLNLQHAPELRFQRDASIDMSEKLASIVRDDEARARAAGREPEPAPAPAAASAAVPPASPLAPEAAPPGAAPAGAKGPA